MSRRRVLVFRSLPAAQMERLEAAHDVVVADPRVAEQKPGFEQALADADGMIGSSVRMDEAMLDKAPRLRVVSSISVGVDNYPLAALAQRGIMLCHTPGVLTETVADLIFAMVLASSRRVCELAQFVAQGRWQRNIGPDLFGWDVHGKTLGILGYGRIGHALATRAALGFGMPVLYHSRRRAEDELQGRSRFVDFDTLLCESDFLVVTLPLTAETRGMMGEREFGRMKPSAIFVNGARGPIVQSPALLAALDAGRLRGAALDVFDVEPLPQDSPFIGHPKVLALPHAGSATHETRDAMAEMATTNLLLALDGKPPLAAYPLGNPASSDRR